MYKKSQTCLNTFKEIKVKSINPNQLLLYWQHSQSCFLSIFSLRIVFAKTLLDVPQVSQDVSLEFVFWIDLRSHWVDKIVNVVEQDCKQKGDPSKDDSISHKSLCHRMFMPIHINKEHSFIHGLRSWNSQPM